MRIRFVYFDAERKGIKPKIPLILKKNQHKKAGLASLSSGY